MSRRSPQLETFLQRLRSALGERLTTEAAALLEVSHDASHQPHGEAAALLRPVNTDEVSRIAREAAALGIALVPRGAGTGKAGGCIPAAGQVVVDLSQMNQLLELRPSDLYAVVQPGLITEDLDRAAGECGMMYPPDPASWGTCTLGGNIATNAGGPRAVKYGVTERYVWSLEVVLAGGTVLRLGRHSIKGVGGLDLKALFIGSEGVLGFITRATLHLVPAPRGVQTAWLSFADAPAASRAADRMFAAGLVPRMLELLDKMALGAVRPRVTWPMPQSGAALLVEADASSEAFAYAEMQRLCDAAAADSVIVGQSEAERQAMRETRRQVSAALKAEYPFKVSDDISVPRGLMPALLAEAQRAGAQVGLPVSAYGHLGDGNLHINLLCKTLEERKAAAVAQDALWRYAVGVRGSISGEHGIGLTKRAAFPLQQAHPLLALQRQVKGVFDPSNIMNPGKVFAA